MPPFKKSESESIIGNISTLTDPALFSFDYCNYLSGKHLDNGSNRQNNNAHKR